MRSTGSRLFTWFIALTAILMLGVAGSPERPDPLTLVPSDDEWAEWVAKSGHQSHFSDFEAFLKEDRAPTVGPAWHLWRQGTDWREVEEPPFAAPPRESWVGAAAALRLLSAEVVPRVGPVIVVSGYREPEFNQKAGGAKTSRHMHFDAFDVVPVREWQRETLHTQLLSLWTVDGPSWNMGLGLYQGTRFHVDVHRWRKWGG